MRTRIDSGLFCTSFPVEGVGSFFAWQLQAVHPRAADSAEQRRSWHRRIRRRSRERVRGRGGANAVRRPGDRVAAIAF
tara:strand:+ start:112 stop:345 length:234 start_codon:yes stop_codon:yes gene_type:complete